MIKTSSPRRNVVAAAPRPSRIRRDPPPPVARPSSAWEYPAEWESWTVGLGVVGFAIAITIIIIGFSDYTAG